MFPIVTVLGSHLFFASALALLAQYFLLIGSVDLFEI